MEDKTKQIDNITEEITELEPKSVVKKPKSTTNITFLNPFTNGQRIADTGAALVPDWWSKTRDKRLDQLAKSSDYYTIAIRNIEKKVFSVPPVVKLNDDERGESDEDKQLLKFYQAFIQKYWYENLSKIIYNTLVFDNGWFIELNSNSGGGSKSQIKPSVLSDGTEIPVAGWEVKDTLRCVRTGDDKYPVKYISVDNKEYKFHKTRILFGADMPSSDPAMYGVGFSSLSSVLQNLTQMKGFDDLVFDQVWSGDVGEIWFYWDKNLVKGTLDDILKVVSQKEADYNKASGTKTITIESDSEVPPKLENIPLRKLPEGFEKDKAVEQIMTLIAFSIGVDVREIYHVKGGGATKADAETQDKKANKKFVSWFLTTWENIINTNILPDWLIVNFDDIDEDDLKRKAEARKLLAETHKMEIENGTITTKIAIEQLFEQKHITEAQRDLLISDYEERQDLEAEQNKQPILGAVIPTPDRNQQTTEDRNTPQLQRQIKQAEPGVILTEADGFVITDGDIKKAVEEANGTKIGDLIN